MADTLYDYPNGTNIQDKTSTIEDAAIIPCIDSQGVVSKTTVGAIRTLNTVIIPSVSSLGEIAAPTNGQMVICNNALHVYWGFWVQIASLGE